MIKLYPDRTVPALLRVLADLVTTAWAVAWGVLGWVIYKTVMGLEVIADGLTNTGMTFNSWITSFRNAIPGGIPGVTQFLMNVADTLRKYSGDPLVSGGHQVHDAIIKLAVVLALVSTHHKRPVPDDIVVCGEVGLAGEIRQVRQIGRRLQESARLGFRRALVPASTPDNVPGIELLKVDSVLDAIAATGLRRPADN